MDKWDESAAKAWAAILAKVRALNEAGETLEGIAKLLDIKNRGSISLWLSGGRKAENTSFPNMLRYLERLGFDYAEFLPSPTLPTIRRPAPHAPVEEVQGEDLPRIPVVGATGAGDGVELFNAHPEYWLPVLPQYAKPDIIGLVVEGDSMEPTIHKGAVVGIIPYDGSINEGGIYLVQRPPFGRTIKRIKMGEDDQIVLHSDNPSYAPTPVPFEGYEKIILGRVIWIWQTC